jgi:tRNA pseudouridine13 synthase
LRAFRAAQKGGNPAKASLQASPPEEAAIGIQFYTTSTAGTGGRLKAEPEDFVVEERTNWPPEKEGGPYLTLQVRARNWETNRLVGRISREYHVSRNRVSFAGTKDKRAVTTQGFSVKLYSGEERPLRLPDIEVLRQYRAARSLSLGDLSCNTFEIAVTQIEGSAQEGAALAGETLAQVAAAGGFANYYGTQRFGSLRPVTHRVGAALVSGDFEGAAREYVGTASTFESEEAQAFRRRFRAGEAPAELLRDMPAQLSFERQILEGLARAPDKPLDAVLSLPRNLVLMFVHAHQSELFNRILSQRLERGMPIGEPLVGDLVVPLFEHGAADEDHPVEVTDANLAKVTRQVALGRAAVTGLVPGATVKVAGGEMGEIEAKVLEGAGRKASDFVLPAMPRFTTDGVRRPLTMKAGGAAAEAAEVRGGPAVRLKFELPRGSYATVVLREVIKRPESAWARETATETPP